MKRLLAMLMALVMVLGLFAGCGGDTAPVQSAPEVSSLPETEEPAIAEVPVEADSAAEAEIEAVPESVVEEAEPAEEGVEVAGGTYVLTPASESAISYPVADGEEYSIAVVLDGMLLDYIPDGDPAQASGMRLLTEATGISLDYTVFQMLTDGMTLMIASGEWTDIICKVDESYATGIQGALDDDVVLDLAPYIEEFAPDYHAFLHNNDYFVKNAYTDEGELGMFYDFRTGQISGWGIRMDWLEEAGIDTVPQTFDELETACLAVLNHHPELESCYPMAGSFIAQGYESELMYGYGISSDYEFFKDETGKIAYSWTTQGARDYLTMTARWCQEGILNEDQMVSGSITQFFNSIYLDQSLIVHKNAEMWGDSQLAMAEDPNFNLVPMNEITVNPGDDLHFGGAQAALGSGWAISTTCQNPETLISALNWIYTEEGSLAMNFGAENESYVVNPDGSYSFTDLVLNNPDGLAVNFSTSVYTGFEAPKIGLQAASLAKLTNPVQLEAEAMWYSQVRDNAYVRLGSLNSEESEAIAAYSDIQTFAQEKLMAYAIGDIELTDAEWESFCSTIESMGISDIIAVYQGAEDRYDAK